MNKSYRTIGGIRHGIPRNKNGVTTNKKGSQLFDSDNSITRVAYLDQAGFGLLVVYKYQRKYLSTVK